MPLEQTLALVEQQLAQVSESLLTNDALALERSSAGLRQTISHFSDAMVMARRQTGVDVLHTLHYGGRQHLLAAQRQGLARMAAGTERLAAALLPGSTESTYGRAVGARGVSAPGARIYSSTYAH